MKPSIPKDWLVFTGLALLGALVAGWQLAEHGRVVDAQRQMLRSRGRDIATSLEVILKSQARFATISRDRLESALAGLAKSDTLVSLALVNPAGETVTASGAPLPSQTGSLPPGTATWEGDSFTIVELVQILPPPGDDEETSEGGLLLVERSPRPPGGRRPPWHREGEQRRDRPGDGATDTPAADGGEQVSPPGEGVVEQRPEPAGTDTAATPPPPSLDQAQTGDARDGERPKPFGDVDHDEARDRFRRWLREHEWGSGPPRYPPWLSEDQFQEQFERLGLQRFILVVSSRDANDNVRQDAMLRSGLSLAALLALLAAGFGWRNLHRTTDLRLRLVRAGEMNTHLREMNTAAAGLAHETRNPLNSVRGLAQLIADDADTSTGSRQRARTAISEVDRINGRLDEFIAYSRPRSPNPARVAVAAVVDDVVRALDVDREDKGAELDVDLPALAVMADEGQLRQVLFNLILNAFQAIPRGGRVTVRAERQEGSLALTVSDNGPGVPADAHEDIFRPYFTLSEQGTGLGLAVARQIVLAHHWDITYRDADEGGAEFSITGIRLA